MPSNLIRRFVEICEVSGITVNSLDSAFFKNFSTRQSSSHKHQLSDVKTPFNERNRLYWKKLTTEIIPNWVTLGELPREPLRPLLELVEHYFNEANDRRNISSFSKRVLTWAAKLTEDSSPEEVKCLFGQAIQINDNAFCLIEILVRCLQGTFSEQDKTFMLGIVRWLCLYDPSLIGCAKEFEPIYTELKIGPAFNIDCLRQALSPLLIVDRSSLVRTSTLLSNLLKDKTKITYEVMDWVLEFFNLRWHQMLVDESAAVKDDRHLPSYLVEQQGINEPWIRLAQTLCGAGWLKPREDSVKPKGSSKHHEHNYLAILMPTTDKQNTDPLTLLCVADHGLYSFILSHDNHGLILFKNCVEQFETSEQPIAKRKFGRYHNSTYNMQFTELELRRIEAKFSSKLHPHMRDTFVKYFPYARAYTQEPDDPISKKTVNALISLVNSSTFADALQYGKLYNSTQMVAAGAAYHRFYNLLHEMEPDEKKRLKRQRIRFKGIETTFGLIIDNLEHPNDVDPNDVDGCIAGCNRLFIALILSYVDTGFSPEVESIIEVYKMRENPGNKVFSDYAWLSEEEAKRRILILIVSIMSHYFEYPFLGNSVSVGACSNTMVDVTHKIFQALNGTIIKGSVLDLTRSRYMYAQIMELIVLPASQSAVRYADTKQWLNSVVTDSLFRQKHAWFKPEVLLGTLSSAAQTKPTIYFTVEKFLDEFIAVYLQKDSTDFKALLVNIKFAQLLRSLNEKSREELLGLFSSYQSRGLGKADSSFIKQYVGYITQRTAYIGITASGGHSARFFSSAPPPSKAALEPLIKALSGKDTRSIDSFFESLSTTIPTLSPSLCNEQGKSAMLQYLKEIKTKSKITKTTHLQRPMSPITEFFTVPTRSPGPVLTSKHGSCLSLPTISS